MDRPTPDRTGQNHRPGPSSAPTNQDSNIPVALEGREIDSEIDQDPSVLEAKVLNWVRNVGVKSAQQVKLRHAPRVAAEDPNDCNLEYASRETEKIF